MKDEQYYFELGQELRGGGFFGDLANKIAGKFLGHRVVDAIKAYPYYEICALASYYAYEKERPDFIMDWQKIYESEEEVAYQKDNYTILAYRGTHVKKDYLTDVTLLVGQITKTDRYRQSLELAQKLGANLVCGHSLGGSLAIEVAIKLGILCYAFNPGIVPKNISARKQLPSNIIIFRIKGDPISISASDYTSNIYEIESQSLNTHSITNFVNL